MDTDFSADKQTTLFLLIIKYFSKENFKSLASSVPKTFDNSPLLHQGWIPISHICQINKVKKLISNENDLVSTLAKFNSKYFEMNQGYIKRTAEYEADAVIKEFLDWNVLSSCALHCSGLSCTTEELKEYFSKYGKVVNCARTNDGYLIEFDSASAMEKALLVDHVYEDEPIHVRVQAIQNQVKSLLPLQNQNKILEFELHGDTETLTKQQLKDYLDRLAQVADLDYEPGKTRGTIKFKQSVAQEIIKVAQKQGELVVQDVSIKLLPVTAQQELLCWKVFEEKQKLKPVVMEKKPTKQKLSKKEKKGRVGKQVKKQPKKIKVDDMDKLIAAMDF
ncbi:hypothetical protein HK103_004449 [Boothiomyces macroporosus]|uniref:HTH La-type RNA-binding domain-containing protein n=1 Tax=Boothiomyces macroporosus TaxID=261099 RepID=A0AAD5UJD4_9FUNG|nr:hypothetical protein HK103_004449 [Boothiomyces macroporosus]